MVDVVDFQKRRVKSSSSRCDVRGYQRQNADCSNATTLLSVHDYVFGDFAFKRARRVNNEAKESFYPKQLKGKVKVKKRIEPKQKCILSRAEKSKESKRGRRLRTRRRFRRNMMHLR